MDSITIAVCDDAPDWQRLIAIRMQKICAAENFNADIQIFSKCEDIDAALAAGSYFDIYILDIEMKALDMDGIKLGHLIREKYKHDESMIIYLSSFIKYHAYLFDIHPYNFILKEPNEEDFLRKMLEAVNLIKKSRKLFVIQYAGTKTLIRNVKILYLESRRKNVILIYKDSDSYKEIVYVSTLNDEIKKLPSFDFFSPHKSFIINFNYCSFLGKKEMQMANGKIIPVARSKRDECLHALAKHSSYNL